MLARETKFARGTKAQPWPIPAGRSSKLCFRRLAAVLLVLCSTLAACADGDSAPISASRAELVATPLFVQGRAREITSGSANSLAFNSANAAGNLIVVYAVWGNTGSVTISDSRGNAYASAQAVTRWESNNWSAQVFYARNVAAGANTVTATFGTAIANFGIVYIHEYSGIDRDDPLDVSTSSVGTGRAMSSGSAATSNANDLLFGAAASDSRVTRAGTGFTTRSTAFYNRTEDRIVSSPGSYSATATQNGTAWVMQMVAFKADPGAVDAVAPTVSMSSPSPDATVSGTVSVSANAADNVGVAGVQFLIDGLSLGAEDTTPPYSTSWNTATTPNGAHTLTARARDASGNTALSAPITVNVANNASGQFSNEVLATGFELPTCIEFLPDGRMLVAELQGTIRVLPAPYTQAEPTPFLLLSNVGSAGVQQGIYTIALDPDFATNRFYYVFYTLGNPNHDRLSRFTANAALNGTVVNSELVLYEDPQDANAEHHGGGIVFGNDGKIYFTTGEHFDPGVSPLLSSPRGKIHRINKNGTVPTDNPFYDGNGPNVDSIWARGLRNPFRASYDAPTGRLLVGDVGGNDSATAKEEVNLGAAGANYGWPDTEGPCAGQCTSPLYFYPHNGRDASITGGFVYRGSQFPASYQGAYFFADYAQNWIRYLTFDGSGNVAGVFNFEPADGSLDGPYGDIVYLKQGPEGAIYYVDLGYSDTGSSSGISKIRRIRFESGNAAPTAVASAVPASGPAPLTVTFSSAGSMDPEGQPLTWSWEFGDGATSAEPNPVHTYSQPGQYTARLTAFDGVNATLSTPLTISVGTPPVATITSPEDGTLFQAGNTISFGGDGQDPDDGVLPASAFTWNIDFLHEGHVHPVAAQTGVKSGTFVIPTAGHDYSGFTRYRIALTVTDSHGLTASRSVTIYPQKVNLSFSTTPSGLTLHLDGIARVAPFVYDTLIGFTHTIEARDQNVGAANYVFASWSDGGAQQHTIVVPGADQSYTATYAVVQGPPAFVQLASATPQTPQSSVSTVFPGPQTAGNLNAVVIGWNDTTSSIASVTDGAGNVYQVAAPTRRGAGISQAIYYAKNIAGSSAGNAVTVTFDQPAVWVDVRIAEYSGLDPTNPLDVQASAAGSTQTASSGTATTSAATALLLGAGTTVGGFSGAGSGYTLRIITQPDLDILEDRVVTGAGAYSAFAPLIGGAPWVMQMVAFRAAGP